MGEPKEAVKLWDDRPMIEHVIRVLRLVCSQVVAVGECRGVDLERDYGLRCIGDIRPGLGPLAGLEALLAGGGDRSYLVAACDQPLLSPRILLKLVDGNPECIHLYGDGDSSDFDPFPGYYPASLLGAVRDALDREERSVRKLVSRSRPVWMKIAEKDRERLRSVNTRADLEHILQNATGAEHGAAGR